MRPTIVRAPNPEAPKELETGKSQWACRWLQAGTDTCLTFTNDWFYGNAVDGELRLRGGGVDKTENVRTYEATRQE